MIVSLLGTRPTITVLRKRKLGQQVRTDGVQSHLATKSGTPTMGGIVIIIATLVGYLGGHAVGPDLLAELALAQHGDRRPGAEQRDDHRDGAREQDRLHWSTSASSPSATSNRAE